MCISRATVSAVSCLVVPAFICIDLLISLVLKINDDDDECDHSLAADFAVLAASVPSRVVHHVTLSAALAECSAGLCRQPVLQPGQQRTCYDAMTS